MHTRQTLVAIFSLTILLVAGCGGGDSSDLPAIGGGGAATGGGPAYDASTATATISGNIMFEGTPPVMPPIQMAADPFCQQAGAGSTSQEVLVTDDSKLQNVIVYVRSGHPDVSYPTPSTPVVIDQQNCRYAPHAFTMMANQGLTIRNSDSTLHNIHAWAEVNTPFNIGQPVQGMETSQNFSEPEMPLPIRCDVHRWMNSFVGVFDHPFHTTTGDVGTFEIDVPPGTYEVVAWHEKYGESVQTVEVADGATAELNYTFSEDAAD